MPAPANRIMMISTHGYFSAEPELGLPDTGGQVVFVLELSKCLARMGYKVDIFTRQFEKQKRIEKVNDRVRVINIPCGGKGFIPKEFLHEHIPEWANNAHDWIQKRKLSYQFIDSHYWDAGLAGIELAKRLGIPHLHTPHSLGAWKRDNMDGDPKELDKLYNFKTRVLEENVIYDECDAVIATTPIQRDLLVEKEYAVPRDKIYVLPPGYDDRRFFPISEASKEALKTQYGLEGRIILALGRMAHNKGYDLLIEAMKTVAPRVENAQLLLAAGGPDPSEEEQAGIEELKKLTKELNIEDRVLFQGYIPDDELGEYYRMADVFALSSRYEPFGMTAIEAMACGTPTVITTEGGLREAVKWGVESIYANPFDPEAFGHAITNVLLYPEIAEELSLNGSHKARADFTWMGIAQQMLSMIQGFRMRRRVGTRKRQRKQTGDE